MKCTPKDAMNQAPPPVLPAKQDRNTHEMSGDEARLADSRSHQTRGGGHRSGSRGAGTFENSDGKTKPNQNPKSRYCEVARPTA
jgi:ribosome assembly protein YihI (activator of Der GTPase)